MYNSVSVITMLVNIFIYSITFYRVFRRGNKYIKENLGLIIIGNLVFLTEDNNKYIEYVSLIIGLGLCWIIIYKASKSKDNNNKKSSGKQV